MEAHPYEAKEAFAEGVKIKWLSTVKQFGQDEVLVERMAMTPDGSGCVGTGTVRAAQGRFPRARRRPALGCRVSQDCPRRRDSAAATSSKSIGP